MPAVPACASGRIKKLRDMHRNEDIVSVIACFAGKMVMSDGFDDLMIKAPKIE